MVLSNLGLGDHHKSCFMRPLVSKRLNIVHYSVWEVSDINGNRCECAELKTTIFFKFVNVNKVTMNCHFCDLLFYRRS